MRRPRSSPFLSFALVLSVGLLLLLPACGGGGGGGGPRNRPPDAQATAAPTSGTAPLNVDFDASASSDPDGSIASYAWDFGDGATGSGVTASHTYTAAGTYTVTLTVTDDQGATDTWSAVVAVREETDGLPPDPSTVAPPLGPGASFAESVEFLYSGSDVVQSGVDPDVMGAERVSVLRGQVFDADGEPLAGVAVTVLGRPEFGQTLTRADGAFDLAVNGGGWLTVDYQKDGYLRAQRRVQVPWNEYVTVPNVRLLALDPQVTTVALSEPGMKVARGSKASDADGERQATLLVPEGVRATAVLPNGTTRSLSTLSIRATEFTVGQAGPERMPAELPPTSGYTYAVEFSADEALNADRVDFDTPLIHYVEDFIGFPVGSAVPTGYYDRQEGRWVASENGRVVKVVGEENGLAQLDTDGDGQAEDQESLNELGVTEEELQRVAELYEPGQTLWRVPIPHFTPWDCNWPYGPPPDALPPFIPDPPSTRHRGKPCEKPGSTLLCEPQVLAEELPIAGIPFRLHYRSDLQRGRSKASDIEIPLIGDTVPASLQKVDLSVLVAGVSHSEHFDQLQPNQTYRFGWAGLDSYGRPVWGPVPYRIQLTYHYPLTYYEVPGDVQAAFGRAALPGVRAIPGRDGATVELSTTAEGMLFSGGVDETDIGGWNLGVHHRFYPETGVILYGNGEMETPASQVSRFERIAGGGDKALLDLEPGAFPVAASELVLANVDAMLLDAAADSAGNIYFCAPGRIDDPVPVYRIGETGQAEIFAVWDGLRPDGTLYDYDVEVGPDDRLVVSQWYVAGDSAVLRIVRLGPGGAVETDLRTTPALAVGWTPETYPGWHDLAVGPDGSMYVSVAGSQKVYKVAEDGSLVTVAGREGGCPEDQPACGDGGPATEAGFTLPVALAVDGEGALYVADGLDSGRSLVRRIDPGGTISTVAGCATGNCQPSGSRFGPATSELTIARNDSLGVLPDQRLAVLSGDLGSSTLFALEGETLEKLVQTEASRVGVMNILGMSIGPEGPIVVDIAYLRGDFYPVLDVLRLSRPKDELYRVGSPDGLYVYEFDQRGLHVRTRHARTEALVYAFQYDDQARLTGVVDALGRRTEIRRNAAGRPTAVVSPEGLTTQLRLDDRGYLSQVIGPEGDTWTFRYATDEAEGLLVEATDPSGAVRRYNYDENGRLVQAQDPMGNVSTLTFGAAETGSVAGWTVSYSSPEGNETRYTVDNAEEGTTRLIRTFPGGERSEVSVSSDGRGTVASLPDGTEYRTELVDDPWLKTGTLGRFRAWTQFTTPQGRRATAYRNRWVRADGGLVEEANFGWGFYRREYDPVGRIWAVESPEGRTAELAFDETGRIASLRLGGMAPLYADYRDSDGRLRQVSAGEGVEARTYALGYDDSGYLNRIENPVGEAIERTLDDAGRVASETLPDGTQMEFAYDQGGRVAEVTLPNQAVHAMAYDASGRLSSYKAPSGGETRLAYDGEGRLVEMARPDGMSMRAQYQEGRLSGLSLDTSRGSPWSVTIQWEGSGRPGSLTTSEGVQLDLSWDGFLPIKSSWSGPVSGSVSLDYFDDTLLPSAVVINDASKRIDLDYDYDGNIVQAGDLWIEWDEQTPWVNSVELHSVWTEYVRNDFGEVMRAVTYDPDGEIVFDVQNTRDRLGRVTARTETIRGDTTRYQYEYDAMGRLTGVSKNGIVWTQYSYDANGNRVRSTDDRGTQDATFDSSDRILAYGSAWFTHGAWGQRTEKSVGQETTRYRYDALGRLRGVDLPDGTELAYVLDPFGRRVGKRKNGTLVQGFLYEGHRVVAELDGNSEVRAVFVYATHRNTPDYMIMTENDTEHLYRILFDDVGSVRLVLDAETGETVQRIDYDPFGRVLLDTNPGFQPFGFAGGLYDQDTGLVHMGLRDYDPECGRFLTPDPLLFAGSPVNLYEYAGSDPVNRIDLWGTKDFWGKVADVSAGIGDAMLNFALFGFGEDVGHALRKAIGVDKEVDPCSSYYQLSYAATDVALNLYATGKGLLELEEGINAVKNFGRRSIKEFVKSMPGKKPLRKYVEAVDFVAGFGAGAAQSAAWISKQ